MSSVYKLSLEWCVEVPLGNEIRKSPAFLLNDNELFFNFFRKQLLGNWFYGVDCELINKRKNTESCFVTYQIGFKNEESLSLAKGKFQLKSEHHEVWYIHEPKLQSKIHDSGKYIKFLFEFEEMMEPLTEITRKTNDKSVQTSSYIDTGVLLDGISKDYSKLFLEGPHHDVEFAFGEDTIKAHKSVLCCRSDVFASMFQADMLEGKTGQVKIQDMDAAIFRQFLKCLYTGELPELTVDVAVKFYEAADKYAVGSLKKQCARFLEENLSPENACDMLILTDRHSDPDFKKNVVEYVVMKEIPFIGEKWSGFCKDNPVLATEVLNLFCQTIRRK